MTSLVHVLVDLENVQPPAALLENLAPGFANAWIFHGPHQEKLSKTFKTLIGERATLVPITRTGNNALDFHLSFYLGYVAAKHPDARLVVVANDKGYEPMIEHAVSLGFEVRREGYNAADKTTPKKAAPDKGTPAKKAVAKKKAEKKATPVAKKSATKKKVPTKKKLAVAIVVAPKKSNASNDLDTPAALRRVVKAFSKMGAERPQKKTSFLRHLSSMLGKDASQEALTEAVSYLQKRSIVAIDGDKVTYV
ncbi:PIN domain-containing protein [Verminephrobacter eiseniae]|uniref:PIN domain-containing protein n=1 Tax=Verminephrobacter eiseniae TaxID=364317 RepID=UPI002237C973|nr:PIN domain-containing protein [Verminephrobacter eiseniae]